MNSQFFKAIALITRLVEGGFETPSDARESWFSLLSFGFFIMLFAIFFVIVPDYYSEVVTFFEDFELQEITSNVQLPAPIGDHPVVYETVMRFCIVFGVFQFFAVALRFYFGSSVKKAAETVSNILFWLGTAYVFSLLLSKSIGWFSLVGGIIVAGGLSIIVRSLIVLLYQIYRH
ncbi:MAG: hypothetical protein JSV64_01735 [Candidatus Bathyarchaeota archaeon]|nr:MAG: hypothetical protein JSV64_01735 [Candidatus Bathyarchaeota archaeon]